MPASLATSGYGTILYRERPGSPGTFDVVEEIFNLGGPSESLETIDCSHLTSPGARREFIASLLDSGEMTFEANFLPQAAIQAACRGDLSNRTLRKWRVAYTDEATTTYEFNAFVTSWEPSAQVDDRLSVSAAMKITSEITKL